MCVIYQAIADSKLGEAVRLTFQITQITKDQQLLLSFKDYFGCGNFRERIGLWWEIFILLNYPI